MCQLTAHLQTRPCTSIYPVEDHPGRGVEGYAGTLRENWTGNVAFGAAHVRLPQNLEELQACVREGQGPIRCVGRGHSFTPVAECAGGTLISLSKMNQVLEYTAPTAERNGSITIEGGSTYSEVHHTTTQHTTLICVYALLPVFM